jgi:hypothetical protein
MDRFIVVLDREIAVEMKTRNGVESVAVHGPGEFFGGVHSLSNSLSGRPSLVTGRMAKAGRVVSIDRPSLRSLMQNDAELRSPNVLIQRRCRGRRRQFSRTSSRVPLQVG